MEAKQTAVEAWESTAPRGPAVAGLTSRSDPTGMGRRMAIGWPSPAPESEPSDDYRSKLLLVAVLVVVVIVLVVMYVVANKKKDSMRTSPGRADRRAIIHN